jgi:GNAT superfamily N-acetyltransferase
MPSVDVHPLPVEHWWVGAGVAARALHTNPTFRWMLGDDPLYRIEAMNDMLLDSPAPKVGVTYGAWRKHVLLGVAAMTPASHCLGTRDIPDSWRQPPEGDPGAAGSPRRYQHVFSVIASHDPTVEHWHIAPVGVEPGFQGLGIGRAVMGPLVARLDRDNRLGWLETDRVENLRFYAAFGFESVAEVETYGYTTWFLARQPSTP